MKDLFGIVEHQAIITANAILVDAYRQILEYEVVLRPNFQSPNIYKYRIPSYNHIIG